MKRLYARLVRWLSRRSRPAGPDSGGSLQFFATEITGVDPATGRVMWSITKDGFRVFTPDVTLPSGDRSDPQATL